MRIAAGPASEVNHLAFKAAAELRNVRVIAIQKGDAMPRQRRHQLVFGPRHAGDAVGKNSV